MGALARAASCSYCRLCISYEVFVCGVVMRIVSSRGGVFIRGRRLGSSSRRGPVSRPNVLADFEFFADELRVVDANVPGGGGLRASGPDRGRAVTRRRALCIRGGRRAPSLASSVARYASPRASVAAKRRRAWARPSAPWLVFPHPRGRRCARVPRRPRRGARGPPRDVGCPRGFSADRRGRLARLDARGTAARRGAATCPPRSRPLPAAPPGHHREPRRLPRRQRGDSHERRRVRGLPRGHLRQRSHRRLHLPRHAPQLRPQRGVQHQVQSHRVRVQVLRRPGPRLRRQRRAQHHGGAVRFRRGRRSAHLRRRGLLLLRRHRFHPLRSQRLDRRRRRGGVRDGVRTRRHGLRTVSAVHRTRPQDGHQDRVRVGGDAGELHRVSPRITVRRAVHDGPQTVPTRVRMPRRRDDDAVSRRPVRRRRFLAVSQLPQRIHLRHARHGHPREVPSEVLLRSRGDRLRGVLGGVRVRDGGHPVAHDMPRGGTVRRRWRTRALPARRGTAATPHRRSVTCVQRGRRARRKRRPRRWCVRRGRTRRRDRRRARSATWDSTNRRNSRIRAWSVPRGRDVPCAPSPPWSTFSAPRGRTVDTISSRTPSRGRRTITRTRRDFRRSPRRAEPVATRARTGTDAPRRSSRPSCVPRGRRG